MSTPASSPRACAYCDNPMPIGILLCGWCWNALPVAMKTALGNAHGGDPAQWEECRRAALGYLHTAGHVARVIPAPTPQVEMPFVKKLCVRPAEPVLLGTPMV